MLKAKVGTRWKKVYVTCSDRAREMNFKWKKRKIETVKQNELMNGWIGKS